METQEKQLYCILGLIKAAESSSKDKESHLALAEELKKNHIEGYPSLIEGKTFLSIMTERCDSHALTQIMDSILAEYMELGFNPSIEDCEDCTSLMSFKGSLCILRISCVNRHRRFFYYKKLTFRQVSF